MEQEEDEQDYQEELLKIIDNAVPRTDTPSLPTLTFRVWFLGLTFGAILNVFNTLLTFRTNVSQVDATIVVILTYPLGNLMAHYLPEGILNPGPFNHKEHALIYLIAKAMGDPPYAINNVIGQKYMLYQELRLRACVGFGMITQLFGHGLGGLSRRFLVKPVAMLWPNAFGTLAMLNGLHGDRDSSGGLYRWSHTRLFWFATAAMFCWTFFPQYIAPMLGGISVVCMFARNSPNNKMAMVLGTSAPGAGMGFLSFSLDWSNFTFPFMPISTPLWSMFNSMFGMYLILWVVIPLCWHFNVFGNDQAIGKDSIYGFALNSPLIYNTNGTYLPNSDFIKFDPNERNNLLLNDTFYELNQPIRVTTFFALVYGIGFLTFVSAIVHVALWYGHDILGRFQNTLKNLDHEDIHSRLMNAYPQVPDWWYYLLLAVCGAAMLVVCTFGGFQLPWWGILLAIAFAIVTLPPIAIIQAISGQQIAVSVVSQFLIGLLLPGKVAATMAFKTFSYMGVTQALGYVEDLKLGHYVKIPPRALFVTQLVSTILGSFISILTACALYESFGTSPDPDSPLGFVWNIENLPSNSGWNIQNFNTYVSAGIIWGGIGPAKFFGPGSPYYSTLLGFVAGLILPVIPWVLHKIYPTSFWHLINVPLMFFMRGYVGNQNSNLITPLLVCVIVNYYIKKYYSLWWKRYALVMGAAFDFGSSLAVVCVFFIGTYFAMPFPRWLLNPVDRERCLPDALLQCNSVSIGNGFGEGFAQDPSVCGK
ncbi:OPT superfamily oligopeptide transporter [Rhizoclosmatium globosum]|uniref:OPT superfamily oligopeptide transporter n=1 Tax=Rhizoclosmatium globosum TaxID=329046 RepID=A0A1Y2CCK0_9FUNG|nr:OPT superfamily oligopeptide transporter [Rhizoclosmatium globosum]|eukprot:ORY44769.1 OPT superfamily oligopeptide transporter [Rhizoclosmatium globosum]